MFEVDQFNEIINYLLQFNIYYLSFCYSKNFFFKLSVILLSLSRWRRIFLIVK